MNLPRITSAYTDLISQTITTQCNKYMTYC